MVSTSSSSPEMVNVNVDDFFLLFGGKSVI